ncbi:hypothetical protein ACIGZJ_05605 [Kitasatospora sp. NPDC052868]|uniref:hypothetical protein n=1 Tax=Kitasatospora sp. NPDC052868 TaxID=3364060 RepID=UPI0037C88BF9
MTDRIRSLRAAVFAALCVALAATAHVAMGGAGVSPAVLAGAFGLVLGFSWLLAGRQRGLGLISLWMVAAQTVLHLVFQQAGTSATGGGGLGRLAGTDWAGLLLCNPQSLPADISPTELARMAGLDPDTPPVSGIRAMAGMHHSASSLGAVLPGSSEASGMSGMAGMSDMPGMTGMTGMGSSAGTPPHGMSAHGMSAHDMSAHGMSAHGMSAGMLAAHVLAALACALLLWRGEAALVRLFDLLAALAGALLPILVLAAPRGYRPPAAPRPVARRARPPRLVLLSHALVRRGPPSLVPAC